MTSTSDATTTYHITETKNGQAITAHLSAAMPSGVTLTVSLVPPTGATSLGPVTLDATARTVVSGILQHTDGTRSITYAMSANASAGVVPLQSRSVTLTIISQP